MGCYEILPGGQQVKCWWNRCMRVSVDDIVPQVGGESSYCIVLREGGYAIVIDSKFVGVWDTPCANYPLFDKYGDVWADEFNGLFGEEYSFHVNK